MKQLLAMKVLGQNKELLANGFEKIVKKLGT